MQSHVPATICSHMSPRLYVVSHIFRRSKFQTRQKIKICNDLERLFLIGLFRFSDCTLQILKTLMFFLALHFFKPSSTNLHVFLFLLSVFQVQINFVIDIIYNMFGFRGEYFCRSRELRISWKVRNIDLPSD